METSFWTDAKDLAEYLQEGLSKALHKTVRNGCDIDELLTIAQGLKLCNEIMQGAENGEA